MSWWNANYGYRKKLTIDNLSQTDNDLIDFPLCIELRTSNFNFSNAQTRGQDVRFVDSDDSTELKYDIEYYNSDDEEASIWVKVPTITKGSATGFIYMYYGYADAADNQDTEAVWDSNHKLVMHMDRAYALKGNGNSYYTSQATTTDFNFTDAITLEAWIMFDPVGDYRGICGKQNTGTDTTQACYNLALMNTGDIRFVIGGVFTKDLDCNLQVAKWHHIVATYDKSHACIYVDGSCEWDSTSYSDPIPTNTAQKFTTHVKMYGASRAGYFPGTISELRVWDKALSSSEVQDLYDGNEVDRTDLYAEYNFTEGSGTTAADSSGNGRTLTLSDSAMWSCDFMLDVTSNKHKGTPYYISGGRATGKVDGAKELEGSPDKVKIGDEAGTTWNNLNFAKEDPITLEFWVKTSGDGWAGISKEVYSAFSRQGYCLGMGASQHHLSFAEAAAKTNNIILVNGSTTIDDGAWHHCIATYDGSVDASGVTMFVDGGKETNSVVYNNLTTSISSGNWPLQLGADENNENYLTGFLDEVRISNVERTEDWCVANYLTQSNSSAGTNDFPTYGAEETPGDELHYMMMQESAA